MCFFKKQSLMLHTLLYTLINRITAHPFPFES